MQYPFDLLRTGPEPGQEIALDLAFAVARIGKAQVKRREGLAFAIADGNGQAGDALLHLAVDIAPATTPDSDDALFEFALVNDGLASHRYRLERAHIGVEFAVRQHRQQHPPHGVEVGGKAAANMQVDANDAPRLGARHIHHIGNIQHADGTGLARVAHQILDNRLRDGAKAERGKIGVTEREHARRR